VLVAAGTVMMSMLGLFAVGLPVMNGTAVVTMVATLVVMVAAITLFPALLGYLGRRIDRLRVPLGRRRPARISAGRHLVTAAGWKPASATRRESRRCRRPGSIPPVTRR